MSLEITRTERDDTVTLTVKGEIDMSTAGEFRRALDDSKAPGRLVLDLTGVEYLDSAGVKVLYDHLGQHPEVVVSSGTVILRILAITGLLDQLTIRES
ncbi:MAG TPA: STAS domain-containing protein [Streptosporangiaceae bacterium]|jgi:anti-anti-sigma factor